MNGVTGRMGTNQHLIRSICAIRDQGGILMPDGDHLYPDPILIGRNEKKLETLAKAHQIDRYSTDLTAALRNKDDAIFLTLRQRAAGFLPLRPLSRRESTSIAKNRLRSIRPRLWNLHV